VALARRRIGRTGIEVTELGFGGNVLGNLYTAVDDAAARDTVAAAYETGVRYFDTAPLYGHGLSERRLGDALRGLPRDAIVLSTKVGRLLQPHGRVPPPKLAPAQGGIFAEELPFRPVFDFSYDATMRSFEDSLQRLGMNRVDILLIHDADEWSQGGRYEEALQAVECGALRALEKLKADGLIGAFGAGVNQVEACERLMGIGPFDCFLLAGRYTLLEQGGLDTLLPRCQRDGVSIILGAPFNSGILVTGATPDARYNYLPAPAAVKDRVARIERVCAAHGVALAAAALQFTLGHPAVATVIPGAKSRAEAEQNARWIAEPIPASLWTDLMAEDLLRADAPVPGHSDDRQGV
jgi:D-threo-aldose 1-dehydrogenase